jgi:hypothetical protein
MCEQNIKVQCHSPLSELMEKFIHEKQAYGYSYTRESHELLRLDRFLCKIGLQSLELPRNIVFLGWTVSYAKSVYNPLNCLVTSSISGQQNRLMRNRATRGYE